MIYTNILDNKSIILKENKNKSGVYKFTNTITDESYVGSSSNMAKRFYSYFSVNYLKDKTVKHNSRIYTALLKHGYSSFNLEILEYLPLLRKYSQDYRSVRLEREQHYIDLLKPKYNIALKAGSLLGFKHSEETKLKFKNRHNKTGYPIILINKDNNNINNYSSVRAAAKDLNISHTTLLRYINESKILKNKYIIIAYFVRAGHALHKKHKTRLCFDT
jgi:excinuclease UvrABC nuclease subunit